MIRNFSCLVAGLVLALCSAADTVQTARLGALHPKNGVVVTNVNLTTYTEKSFVAPDFDATNDYSYGDVVAISNRFYVFNQDWHHQWSGSPIEYQCVDELTSLQQLGKYLFAKDYLTLGYGGTNAPSYKKIYVGHENNNACYFILKTSGFQFEDEYGGEFRMIGDEFRYTSDGHMWSKRLRNMLTIDSILPFTSTYLAEAYKQNPTSPYYVHAYLTNNYLTAGQTSDQYLKKTDAASTYMTETAADGKYSTPEGVASAIASALNSQRVTCLYNSSGNYRLNYNGQIQRQTHNGYNVSWTNESSGLVLMYANPNKWWCEHPQLGELWFTRSDGVISCDSMAIIRGEEDYPGTTVITIPPLGTFRAFVNAYGTLSWNDYDRFAKESEVGDYAAVSNKAMNALSRAEAEAGFTEWVCSPATYLDGEPVKVAKVATGIWAGYWTIFRTTETVYSDETAMALPYEASDTITNLTWHGFDSWGDGVSAARTRLPTMADIAAATNYTDSATNSLASRISALETQYAAITNMLDGLEAALRTINGGNQ